MLKKLRRKIIWINMLLCGVLLLGIISVVCASSYIASSKQLEAGLRIVLEERLHTDFPAEIFDIPHREMVEFPRMQGWMLDAYTIVTVDYAGEIQLRVDQNTELPENVLSEAVAEALGSGSREGVCRRASLMYVMRDSPEGMRIAFADTSGVKAELWRNIGIFSVLFACGIGVIFCISLGLSVLAVRPVEQAWRKQKQFIADASHELKTPLTVILANTRILLSHPEQTVERQTQWITSTDEEAHTMQRMVEQMLELARTDAKEVPPIRAEVDLSGLIEGCALCFEPSAYEKEMRIECDIEPGVVIRSDSERLTQLCRILLDNAVKYGSPGSPVHVALSAEARRATLRVQNMGTPIPKDELPHLFDRFYRTDKARGAGGFGLGLAIAKSTVESLGGAISVESTAEHGTIFTVTLARFA